MSDDVGKRFAEYKRIREEASQFLKNNPYPNTSKESIVDNWYKKSYEALKGKPEVYVQVKETIKPLIKLSAREKREIKAEDRSDLLEERKAEREEREAEKETKKIKNSPEKSIKNKEEPKLADKKPDFKFKKPKEQASKTAAKSLKDTADNSRLARKSRGEEVGYPDGKRKPTAEEQAKAKTKLEGSSEKKSPKKITPPKSESPGAKKSKPTEKMKEKVKEGKSLRELNSEREKPIKPSVKLSTDKASNKPTQNKPLLGRDKQPEVDSPKVQNPNAVNKGKASESVPRSASAAKSVGRTAGKIAGRAAAPLTAVGAVGGLLSGSSTKSRAEDERKTSSGANKIPAQGPKYSSGPSTRGRPDKKPKSYPDREPEVGKAMRFSDYKLDDGSPSKNTPPILKDKAKENSKYEVYKKDSKDAHSFREAFSSARKDGKEIFTFKGRKYTTKRKDD